MSLRILLITFILFFLHGCSQIESDIAELPKITKLNEFETIVSNDEVVLANPQRIRYDESESLILYDSGLEKVVRLSLDGKVVQEIGRNGSGPGEYQSVSISTF